MMPVVTGELDDAGDGPSPQTEPQTDVWLGRFHAGDRAVLDACYRAHFALVDRAVGGLVAGADRETIVQQVFLRLLESEPLRRNFQGGTLAGWLTTVARNEAIDHLRRRRFERPAADPTAAPDALAQDTGTPGNRLEDDLEARRLVQRFREDWLRPAWRPVFDLRFVEQVDQRTAAARLGLHRTTLAYRELKIRRLLRRFLLRTELSDGTG